MKKVLILEEQQDVLRWLKNIIMELDEKAAAFAYDSIEDAKKCAVKIPIDLFVVDIVSDPDEESYPLGLTFVDFIRDIPEYIFTPVLFLTSFKDTQLYTYDKLNSYKLIRKPVDGDVFKKVVEDSLRSLASMERKETFYFRWRGVLHIIEKVSVVYIEMVDEKLYIHLRNSEVYCAPYLSMTQMIEKLSSTDFVKCHRHTIVNLNHVKGIDTANRTIKLKYGLGELPIGVTYVEYLEEILREDW